MQKVLTHPQIGEVTISKTRRSKRIMLTVKPNGAVRLSFPLWVTQKRALGFLDEKVEWIAAARLKLSEKYGATKGGGAGAGAWAGGADGAVGRAGADGGAGGAGAGADRGAGVADGAGAENTGAAGAAAGNAATEYSEKKQKIEALRAEAKARLPQMVARLAVKHGFRFGEVRIKLTRSRWGSCTARNNINLSLALAALPDHLAEYIVLHELCHTVHKNHSHRFHALLDHVTDGQSRALNKELRKFTPTFLYI